MMRRILVILLVSHFLLGIVISNQNHNNKMKKSRNGHPLDNTDWIINHPLSFKSNPQAQEEQKEKEGNQIINALQSPFTKDLLAMYDTVCLPYINGANDGESIDIIDHFFYGYKQGIVLEIGALDGTPYTESMSYFLEHLLDWKRILIEGNPIHREGLRFENPNAFSANLVICETQRTLHYAQTKSNVTSGILEFMNVGFLERFHPKIYEATMSEPKGDITTIQDLHQFPEVLPIQCYPMKKVFKEVQITYVNLFILDVEGAELEVLKSIDWRKIRFDVIVVETRSYNLLFRPINYPEIIESFLNKKGYSNCCGQIGRNNWFVYKTFQRSIRPGLKKDCFRGQLASKWQKEVESIEELKEKLYECEINPPEPRLQKTVKINEKKSAKKKKDARSDLLTKHWSRLLFVLIPLVIFCALTGMNKRFGERLKSFWRNES